MKTFFIGHSFRKPENIMIIIINPFFHREVDQHNRNKTLVSFLRNSEIKYCISSKPFRKKKKTYENKTPRITKKLLRELNHRVKAKLGKSFVKYSNNV